MLYRLRFWARVDITCPDKCWNWTGGRIGTGYGVATVSCRKQVKAHRVAYEYANGPIKPRPGPHGTVIRHKCDNRLCCNPSHLEEGTQADNMRDMARSGTRKGEKSPHAILTEEMAKFIKASSRSARSIALEMGISPRAAQKIRAGTRWSHLP